ncbi:HAD family hydrolase [Edaphobacillus lindanitolerans]|uniref:Phosphoglycolate phosphatase n=1 Tax=Edaphobacillus lindanitolerans TaxID=550447 RepID=A0A1U7PND9_9BACI|nr:HAD family hydrolase [Edaphobacillus lindanitolerans]SIT73074.1 phosphoglycolate phosphatase [Edaphobacillus lindanitolerans]
MDSIIFDLDGTLWDSRGTVAKAWTQVVKDSDSVRREVTEKDLKGTMGLQIHEIADVLFDDLSKEERMKLIRACCRQELPDLERDGGELYEGLEETLSKLAETYRLFIVSNCQEGYIESFYAYHGLGHYFEDFENPGRTGLSKGENIRLIIERNGLQSPVYVGDTEGDRTAAEFAGIPFVFASYGFGQPRRYDARIGSVGELVGLRF